MNSRRRQKYLRALRHILVASLMMASFYVGRWTIHWELTNLVASLAYIVTVLVYFRLELREHRRDSQAFREFLRLCEESASHSAKGSDNISDFYKTLHKDGFQLSTPGLEPGDAAVDAMDKAYGYRSYTCPKCKKVSHIPEEVEPYCVGCLSEFEKSDRRG